MRNESHAPPPDPSSPHSAQPHRATRSPDHEPIPPPESTVTNVTLHNSPGLPEIGDGSLVPFIAIIAAVVFFLIALVMMLVMRKL